MTVQAEGIHHWSGWRHSRPQSLAINHCHHWALALILFADLFINCSDIHAREHKIQLRKPLGSFQACLDCRAVFMLQSSTGCAANTSAAWMCLQKCGQYWANRWSTEKDLFLMKLCFFFSPKKSLHLWFLHLPYHLCPTEAPGRAVGALFLSCSVITIVFPILYGALCKKWWKRKRHSPKNIPCTDFFS